MAAAEIAGVRPKRAFWTSPLLPLVLALAVVLLLLSLPLSLPVGPMYWDVFIYYDAANRIFDGQMPVVDFFTPVGPLGYYLFAGWLALFPNAQPVLIAHWSLLALTLPMMAAVTIEADRQSRVAAFGLVLPFLLFSLLPFNTHEYYPYPGSDGFGIYNRQVCQMLYVMVAALLFVRRPAVLTAIVLVAMTSLFFLKITGFVAGLVVAGYALLAGRLSWRQTAQLLAAFAALLVALQLSSGLVSAYLAGIVALTEMNSGTLAPRFLQSLSMNFGVVAPGGALAILLVAADRHGLVERLAALGRERSIAAVAALLDQDGLWLAAVLFAGILFETQNTGSQAMIFVWPVLVAIAMKLPALARAPTLMAAVAVLAAATALPPAVGIAERAARAYAGVVKNVVLPHERLKSLGALNMRPEVLRRAEVMLEIYPTHPLTYGLLVRSSELPSPLLYSDFDFQVAHLMAIDRAIGAIEALERANGIRFETIMSLNFVNPFPWLMQRSAPLHVAIGADPTRAVPPPDANVAAAMRDTDLVLYPRCPPTTANADLFRLYAPMLSEHRRIRLDACFDAFVHPRLAAALGTQ
ncbi:MAG: hypothetical protein ABWZ57_14360 [Mesorhizobium sp.]